ncbi:MAG: TolC family protein [Chlorobi bacterium]|nr:TolC family protein [Chlorobiota bacterium]
MKKITKALLLFIVSAWLAGEAMAQDSPTAFSLEEAQQYAMKNSYVLQNTGLEINKARKKVWETITIGLPQVSGSVNYNKFLNLPVSLIPGEFFGKPAGTYIPVKFGQDYNSDFGITVSQLLFDGSYIVGVGSSKIYLNLALQANEKAKIDIRDAVAQAYYLVLIGEANLKVMKENLENTQHLYNDTKAYYDNGFREEQDVDQMKLMVRSAENEILKAVREIKISKVVLKYTMGFDLDKEITLSDKLDKFLAPLLKKNPSTGFDYTNHIDYKLSQTNYMVSEKLLRLEKSAYLPKLSAFYNWNKTAYGSNANLFKPNIPWFKSSMIGFQLTMPIFSSGQKAAKVQQARIDLEKAENDRALATETLQKEYLTALANMESMLEKYENDKENRQLSEKILNKAKFKFNNGITSSTELSQIETQYLQSHGAYIVSTLQLLQANLALKKALGKL